MLRSARVALLALLCGSALPAGGIVASTCVGDCDLDARVDIADLVTGVKVVIGEASIDACPSIACDVDDTSSVACLIVAVDTAMRNDCVPPINEHQQCGLTVCGFGEICCNPLFSICAPPGEYCIQ